MALAIHGESVKNAAHMYTERLKVIGNPLAPLVNLGETIRTLHSTQLIRHRHTANQDESRSCIESNSWSSRSTAYREERRSEQQS